MNEKEIKLSMFTIGRNSLIKAILALQDDYIVYELEDLRDSVNRAIKKLKEEIENE